MILIKKVCYEFDVKLNALSFSMFEKLKIRVFKYLIDHPDGKYEALLNLNFRIDDYKYDADVEIKLDEYYEFFSKFGKTEEEAIDRLIKALKIEKRCFKNKKIMYTF